MLASMACFAGMSTVIRLLADDMHSAQMVFLRNGWSLLLIIAWTMALQRRALPRFHTHRLSGHGWRAAIGFCAMELWFFSLTTMPLTLAVALSFTTPIFTTIIAIFFLGEKAGIRRWSAIATGFAGVLVILRPDQAHVGAAAFIVLASSALMACAGVVVKSLTRTDPSETIVFYMSLFMLPLSLLPALAFWQPFGAHELGLTFLIALFSTAAHLFLTRAYLHADIVVLMPFDFTRLIFTAILAYFLFGEIMDNHTIAGSVIIMASAIYITHREARLRKKNAVPC